MTNPFHDIVVAGVQQLRPYQPGKPISELEREYGVSDIIKLASNENPWGPSPAVVEAIQGALPDLSLYPDGNGFELKQALAAYHDIDPACITLGNGSNDVLVLLAEALLTSGSEAVYSQYAFAVYALAVQATGAVARISPAFGDQHPMPLGHDLHAMRALITDKTRLIFIANPNNPTGTWLDKDELREFVAGVPETAIVVIDEAYCDYVDEPEYPDAASWLDESPNLVVTRTFSKVYGLAGLRMGYALAHPELTDVLNRIRQPFNVNSLALVAAEAALSDSGFVARSRDSNNSERVRVSQACEQLGVHCLPSLGNFVLAGFGRPAQPIFDALLAEAIIVRPVANYGLPDYLRITIGQPAQNARLLEALQKVL